MKFIVISVLSPVPYKLLYGTIITFLLPYIPLKLFKKDNVQLFLVASTLINFDSDK